MKQQDMKTRPHLIGFEYLEGPLSRSLSLSLCHTENRQEANRNILLFFLKAVALMAGR